VFAIDEKRVQTVARHVLKERTVKRLASTFHILGSPTRVRLLDALCHAEMCVCDLAVLLDLRISTVSHQLALLKRHRVVRSRREGKVVFYALDDRHIRTLFRQGLAHTRHREPLS
jgi:DNA-binding transcriptional ArsR family regulator